MESFENQMWIVCSEITTTAFWHRKTTFSIPNCPRGAEEPLGQCLGPGPAARKRGHPDPGIFLPQDEKRRNILLVCSTRAKWLWGHTFQPVGIFHFFLSLLGFPEALSCFQSWVLWFFLWCAVSAQTKTPERTCIFNLPSVETVKECTIHEGKPKGSWYPNLSDNSLKKKIQIPLSGLKRHWKRKITSTKYNMDSNNYQLLAIREAKNL